MKPDRCPTCGSEDKMTELLPCRDRDKPDPWHDTEGCGACGGSKLKQIVGDEEGKGWTVIPCPDCTDTPVPMSDERLAELDNKAMTELTVSNAIELLHFLQAERTLRRQVEEERDWLLRTSIEGNEHCPPDTECKTLGGVTCEECWTIAMKEATHE